MSQNKDRWLRNESITTDIKDALNVMTTTNQCMSNVLEDLVVVVWNKAIEEAKAATVDAESEEAIKELEVDNG